MAPSRFASLRGRSQSQSQSQPQPQSRHVPSYSADDSNLQRLVAFRYEQTIQAELPIPIPPPRNPLRLNRPATIAAAASSSASSAGLALESASSSASTITRSRTSRNDPLPFSEEHPAFRVPPLQLRRHQQSHSESSSSRSTTTTTTSQHSPSSSTAGTDWRRDSAPGTVSSASTTLPDDHDEALAKLDLDDDPSSSVYSTDVDDEQVNGQDAKIDTDAPRVSCQSRWSLTDSDISDAVSSSREKNTRRKLIRGLSLRLGPPANKRTSRLSKRQTTTPGQAASEAVRAAYAAMAPISVAAAPPHRPPPTAPQSGRSHHSRQSQRKGSPAPHSFSLSPAAAAAAAAADLGPGGPPPPASPSQEIGTTDSQSPDSRDPGPLSSKYVVAVHHRDASAPSDLAPIIRTDIPQGDLLDTQAFEFSNRGSLLMGGKRVISISRPLPLSLASSPSSIMDKFAEPRPAPAAPSLSARRASAMAMLVAKNPSLPDIRVLPDETERESQKVRSLYESADLMHWQDGAPGRLSGEPLSSSPSDGPRQDNLAVPTQRDNRRSVRALYLSPTSLLSATSLPSPRGDARRNEFELAGGIEDWEDVHGEDVDRYGFITVGSERPVSSTSIPAETRSLYATPRTRNGRKVLSKRPPPLSSGLSRVPSRKISARSLNTQASGRSTSSRISVRSGIRAAANMLPHNRDRRIVDAAGDMLSLPPGLAENEEQHKSVQAVKAAQDKEARRAEKWRKMAKFVTKGRDGKGVRFVASNVKKDLGIKFETEDLAKVAAGKEAARLPRHVEIQSVDIEFDNTNPKLIERTWKGIPDRWRSSAWYSFLSSSAKSARCEVTEEQLFAKFHSLQEFSSPDDVQIDLDVPRTINRHIMFRKRYRGGQRLLFRVLHALSLYFPDTGYVQGMAALAASLLCYYDEERCFVMLVRLWQYRGLQRLYQEGFAGLMIALQDLEKHWLHGKPISQKLNQLGIDPTAYGTRWYLTLFNLSIPFAIQLRIWDVFMLLGGSPPASPPSSTAKSKAKEKPPAVVDEDLSFDGLEILHATAAALIDMHKDVIIGGDFENVMKGLTSFQEVKDEDRFVNLVRAEWNMHRGKKRG